MRDAGNLLAGMVAKADGFLEELTYTTFGALQLSGNKKLMAPFYMQYRSGTSRHFDGTPYWKVSDGIKVIRLPLKN